MRCLKVIAALMMLFALNTAVCFALEEETTDNYSSFMSRAERTASTILCLMM